MAVVGGRQWWMGLPSIPFMGVKVEFEREPIWWWNRWIHSIEFNLSRVEKTAVTTNYQNKPPSLFNPSAPPLINLPTSTATPPLCDHSSFLCDHPLIIKRRSLNEWRNTTLSVVTDKHDTYGPKPISGLQFNTPNLFSTFIIYNSIFPYIIKLNSALVESSRKNEGWIDWISRLFNWFNFKDD